MRITREQLVYHFNADTPPVATIAPGDLITVETYDSSTGRIHGPADVAHYLQVRDPHKVNPAAGPIFVEGAEPGDALVVDILAIELAAQGFVRAIVAGEGVLTEGIEANALAVVKVVGDHLIFNDKARFLARPMVGVIGTAPKAGTVYNLDPGPQGSNMDVNAIGVGARVYLPVHVPGALLSLGDVHAAMGDGEVSGTGIEINAEITARVDLIKGEAPTRPWIETKTDWITTGQGETLDLAVKEGVDEMTRLLEKQLDLSRTEAYMLISARGDVRIGQCARLPNCDETVYVVFPKDVERL